jgi:hypothetical protein
MVDIRIKAAYYVRSCGLKLTASKVKGESLSYLGRYEEASSMSFLSKTPLCADIKSVGQLRVIFYSSPNVLDHHQISMMHHQILKF